jgi:hypothetical protein
MRTVYTSLSLLIFKAIVNPANGETWNGDQRIKLEVGRVNVTGRLDERDQWKLVYRKKQRIKSFGLG